MAGIAALAVALPATDEDGSPLLVIALESVSGLVGVSDEDYIWVITYDGHIDTRHPSQVTIDWIYVPVANKEAEEANQPEGVPGQLPDPD